MDCWSRMTVPAKKFGKVAWVVACMVCGTGHWVAELRRLWYFGRRKQTHRPVESKLLKPFMLWGTSKVENNSIDACQTSLAIFIVLFAPKFAIMCCLLGSGCWRLSGPFFFVKIEKKVSHMFEFKWLQNSPSQPDEFKLSALAEYCVPETQSKQVVKLLAAPTGSPRAGFPGLRGKRTLKNKTGCLRWEPSRRSG